MSNVSEIHIPTMPTVFPRVKRDYPISERENLMRALRHEKPLWMPNFQSSHQMAPAGPNEDQPSPHRESYVDWFGIFREYSEAQESCTPTSVSYPSIDDWKKSVVFPNLDELDWREGKDSFVRDETLALNGRFTGGIFQRLHALQGFENALIDLISKPEAVREFLEAMADFEIEVFRRMHAVWQYDFVLYHDDWGTARAPFFSTDLFKETLLPPTIRIFKAIREAGVVAMSHNCGLIDAFIPYLVEDIGAEALEIQPINDLSGIVKKYGAQATVEYVRPDPYFFFDPGLKLAQLKEKAHEIVDTYGAHTNPGAGVMLTFIAPTEEIYQTFDEEIYRYSLEKYRSSSAAAKSSSSSEKT